MEENMKDKILSILICMLLIGTIAPLVNGEHFINPKKNPLSEGYLIITLHAGTYTIHTVENGKTEITMENYGCLITPGQPVLPSKLFYIGLPPGGNVVSIELINVESKDIPGVYQITTGLPITDGQSNAIDTATYTSNKPYTTNTFEYLGMSQMRKYSLAMIRFSPITYYQENGKLVLHNSITLRIHYEIIEQISDILLSDTAMDDIASKFIYNYQSIADYYTADQPARTTFDYVIITTSAVVTSLNGFLTWKTSIGYNVNIVTLTWILANYPPVIDTQQSIRDFLIANYAAWGIKYVLIIGTHASIPMRTCYPDPTSHTPDGTHDIPTDYYYADLTGNWDSDGDGFYGERGQDNVDFVPEVFVGRIPTDGPSAVSAITLKIQNFEQTAYTGWKKNAMLLGAIYTYANEDNIPQNRSDGAEVMEQCKNNILPGFSITTMYEQQGLAPCTYPCTMGLSNANIKAQWGSTTGWGIINWAAHGLPTSANQKVWNADTNSNGIPENNGEIIWPIMLQSTDNGFLNNSMPPIVFAASCFVSHPETGNNLGASLLTQGASAFIGATRASYASMGWTQPSQGGHGTVCYNFTDSIANKNEDCGHALYNAKQYVYNNIPWNAWQDEANMYNFNLYGDPSMGMNLPPSSPPPPTGPTTGIAGIQYTYSAIGLDPTGDKIKYGWDWNGDGTVDQWDDNNGNYYLSWQPCATPHIFNTPGTYNVKVKIEDLYGAQSSFSPSIAVLITPNQPPTKPAKPSGQTNGKPGVSYTYTTSASDPELYTVAYGWDWDGDGIVDQWDDNGGSYYPSGQTISTAHTWSVKGTYNIKVKAKDIHGNEGPWSDPLAITIPKSVISTNLLLMHLLERFPIVVLILRILMNY
jgi:hypothetical protein